MSIETTPTAAATNSPSRERGGRPSLRVGNSGTPSTTAKAACCGANLSYYPAEEVVAGLAPYRGWHLATFTDVAHKRGPSGYVVRSDDEVRLMNLSVVMFTPTQERFEFLARHDFPTQFGNDAQIDAAMQVEANVIAHELMKRSVAA